MKPGIPFRRPSTVTKDWLVTKTDATGKFTITVPVQTDLLVESDGYESKLFLAGEIQNLKTFQLTASEFKYGEKDDVNIAFGKVKKRKPCWCSKHNGT